MINEERVIEIIKQKGPIIPVKLAREVNTNILFASAILSEMVSKGKVKLSFLKVGGTPLYYLPGQETRLQDFIDYLHEKEKKAFFLLKEKKILRDSQLEPVMRVALRNIKDFAKPLEIKIDEKNELFWKWYLLSDEEAISLIKNQIKETKQEPKETKEITESKSLKEKQKPTKEVKKHEDVFLMKIISFFNKNNIKIIEKKMVRKNKEIDFIIKIKSPVGDLEYFCKAKNKKRINDADLASALIQGQAKKLPVLFLTTGDLTKKAKEIIKDLKGIKFTKIE